MTVCSTLYQSVILYEKRGHKKTLHAYILMKPPYELDVDISGLKNLLQCHYHLEPFKELFIGTLLFHYEAKHYTTLHLSQLMISRWTTIQRRCLRIYLYLEGVVSLLISAYSLRPRGSCFPSSSKK